jgi:uncharacterized protein (TIGR03435 family)
MHGMDGACIVKTLLLAVAMSLARAQDTAGLPKFEVASVRISKAPPPRPLFSMQTAPQSLTVLSASLMECLTWSHQIRRWQIAGPDWIEEQRYYIVAKVGAPVDEAEMRRMLRSLLTERFRIVVRTESKETDVVALVVTKSGPKFQPSAADTPPSVDVRFNPANGGVRWPFRNMPLDRLEGILSGPHWDPVINRTGLAGNFDFAYERPRLEDESGGPSSFPEIRSALEKQLGLTLERRRAPVKFLIVERAEKTPVEN